MRQRCALKIHFEVDTQGFMTWTIRPINNQLQISKEEGHLDFTSGTAQQLHNKVCAFAGWPGTSASFILHDEASGK
jgi:hypothetical protein